MHYIYGYIYTWLFTDSTTRCNLHRISDVLITSRRNLHHISDVLITSRCNLHHISDVLITLYWYIAMDIA